MTALLKRPMLTAASLGFALLVVLDAGDALADTGVATPSPVELIKGVQARYAKVTNFKADFRQVVTRKHLPRPLKKQGVVYFKQPAMMRWDYTQPERVYYISDGDILWTYEPSEKTAMKLRVGDSELYTSLQFLFGRGEIIDSFHLTYRGTQDGWAVVDMVPKRSQANYKTLSLHIDAASFSIRATEIVDPLDNVSRIEFGEPSFTDLKASAFRFQPPEGVTVDDMTHQNIGGQR